LLKLEHIAQEALRAASVPGLVIAAARGDGPQEVQAAGVDAAGHPLAADTLFTVASVTKLATALVALRLVDEGVLSLDAPLSRHLPQAAIVQADVTVRHLLCHTSGLPIELPTRAAPYAPGLDWPSLAAACLRQPLERPPETRVQYSNVGYGLLGLIVENLTGQSFAAALEQLVLSPLGIRGYLGDEPPARVAALADVHSIHNGTPLEPFNSSFWRSLALPWAGLVTDAAGALALVRAFMDVPSGFLRPATLAEAMRDQTLGLSGGFLEPLLWAPCPWGLGPELRGDKQPHWAPAQAGPGSFGHLGASGSLAWADPATGLAWAILGAQTTNNGWLLRAGPKIAARLAESAAGA
jgi:beta-lactamase class C